MTSSVKMDNNIKESNLERFQNLVYSDDLDIVCVNETWLSGHLYNAEILQSGYCTVRKDRKTQGGVVLLGIKTAVFKSVCEIEHNHDLEIAMAEITSAKDMKLLICLCYRPPDADKTRINSICASCEPNPKRFWSFFKIKSKVSNIPLKVSVKSSENQRTYSNNNVDIANTFNEYFTSIFTHDNNSDHNLGENSDPEIVSEDIITLTNDEVITVLTNLNNNKAHGPDGIPAHLLTETSSQIAPSLCALFNKSLCCGVLPDDWKLANVVPEHKRGEKSYVENYRPISLLSRISKVIERCVFHNIQHHVFQQINPCQHGFVPRKSCEHN